MRDLICISHLRWGFVWQRPQHLLSRLNQHYRILFVEEPVTRQDVDQAFLEVERIPQLPNLTVLRLVQPDPHPRWVGHGESSTQPVYSRLLTEYMRSHGIVQPDLWLYTPMALDFVETIQPRQLIYDVMDQLSAFRGAPQGLIAREEQLLRQADLVFTGGLSLYHAKQPFNPHTYLFPSGVEQAHWAKTVQLEKAAKPADLAGIDDPIIGYFGVIDERMDLELLRYLAVTRPQWQIVMLGPLAKIERTDLPQAPNLHFLGMKSYDELPAYLAHFKVALIPFALSEATRYLSPTKTLEYLAARRPVVSTPIPDVVELYGQVVKIGDSPASFAAAIKAALSENEETRATVERQAASIVDQFSWDKIAQQMYELMSARPD